MIASLITAARDAARWVIHVSVSSFLRLFWGATSENQPDWKTVGPVVLAPNHCSYADPIFLQSMTHTHFTFLMTEAIYVLPSMRWLFKLWGAIPLPDGDTVKAGAIKTVLRTIRSGQPVVIFPEGSIARDGVLQPGQPGVAALMSRARVPVIPVAILGTYGILPHRALWPRAGRIHIRFGDPIPPPEGDLDRAGIDAWTSRVMAALEALIERPTPRLD